MAGSGTWQVAPSFVVASLLFLGACGSNHSDGDGASDPDGGGVGTGGTSNRGGQGGSSGSSGSSGASGARADCEVLCDHYAKQCAPDEPCGITCDVEEALEPCPGEFAAFYACVVAEPSPTFDCTQSYFAHTEMLCIDQRAALQLCHATGGEDCHFSPQLDPSCESSSTGQPHYAICKLDVTPPAGCVPFGVGYCCP